MLNSKRSHGADRLSKLAQRITTSPGAQLQTESRSGSAIGKANLPDQRDCAQLQTESRSGSGSEADRACSDKRVLNSKRSHGADRFTKGSDAVPVRLCSTPNGVTERIGAWIAYRN